MSKNILVITTIYPSPDIKVSNNTNVVHYFAREWIKMGYNVHVVFNYPIYLKILHFVARFIKNTLASKFNTAVTAVYTNKDYEFEMDGVKIIRMPLFKPLPHFRVPHIKIDKQIKKIVAYCKKEKFIPEAIVAHNFYPHLEMVNRLKNEYFPDAKTCVVVHKQNLKMLTYVPNYRQQVSDLDIWGFRSIPLQSEFESFVGKVRKSFICYSGVPSFFLSKKRSVKSLSLPITKFIYIGSFIKRKHADKLLLGLKAAGINNFHLDFVGNGVMRSQLEKFVSKEKWENKVEFHGFLPRTQVPYMLERAECFCMISEEETFGLVYLEAMSKGLITIASRGEGMEGIIIDGINGFLCKAGDSDELAALLSRIEKMDGGELMKISEKAQETAYKLSDKTVAEMYINNVLNT